jgi:SHS2 domain-containing protein
MKSGANGAESRELIRWEHFPHGADIGIRGIGQSPGEAFENAALALTAAITDPGRVDAQTGISVECNAPDLELLLVDWLNTLIYEMATRHMLFCKFSVVLRGTQELTAKVLGEIIDIGRHRPAVEIKGATYTGLHVGQRDDGLWIAQCVVDV